MTEIELKNLKIQEEIQLNALKIGVEFPKTDIITKPLVVTENGVYKESGANFSPVTVNVPVPKVKPFTFTKNGVYNVSQIGGFIQYDRTFTFKERMDDYKAFKNALESRGIVEGEIFIQNGENVKLSYEKVSYNSEMNGSGVQTTMVFETFGEKYAYLSFYDGAMHGWYKFIDEVNVNPNYEPLTVVVPTPIGDNKLNHIDILSEYVFTESIRTEAIHGANPITVDVKPNPVPLEVTENGVYENEQGFSPVTVVVPKNYHEVVKMIINSTGNCNGFFINSTLSDVSEYLRYDTTENATTTRDTFRSSQIKCCPSLNLGKSTACTNMFSNMVALEEVLPLHTPNVEGTVQMFNQDTNLIKIHELDVRSVTDARYMFTNCRKLKECRIKNIKTALQVGSGNTYGHLLTVESLIGLIYELRDTDASLTLTIGTANLEKLTNVYVRTIDITDEMQAEDDLIEEKHPFEVCESTDDGAIQIVEYAKLKNWNIA